MMMQMLLLLPLKVFSYCLLLLVLAACTSESMTNEKSAPIELHMSLEQPDLLKGRVVLVSKLSNFTQGDITFLPWNTPFDTNLNGNFLSIFALKNGEKVAVDYRGLMVKRAAPSSDDYVTLEAGSTLTQRMEITNSYTFCTDTGYILEFSGVFATPAGDILPFSSTPLNFRYSNADADC